MGVSKKWLENLREAGAERGWLIQPPDLSGEFLHPPLPPNLLKILRRIRTNSCVYKIYPQMCECGTSISFTHIFQKCPYTEENFNLVSAYSEKHNLKPHEFLLHHSSLHWEPARLLCRSVYLSDIGHLFLNHQNKKK